MSNDVADSPEELIVELEKAGKNTSLEGIEKVYEKHSGLVDFIYENGDLFCDGEFMGETGFIGSDIQYDSSEMLEVIKNTNGICVSDFCRFSVDLLDFIVLNLDEVCQTNSEVIQELSNFAGNYKFGNEDDVYNSLADQYRKLRSFTEEKGKPPFEMVESNIILLQFFAVMRNFYSFVEDSIVWENEPNVGEKVIYTIIVDDLEDMLELEVKCELNNQIYNEEYDIMTYDYEIIDYDSEIDKLNFTPWVIADEDDEERCFEPIHENQLRKFEE